MPYLNKPKKKRRQNRCSDSKVYNNRHYFNLRESLRMQMPLCVLCLSQDKTVPTEHLHHIIQISTGETEEDRLRLLLDPMNIIGLCQKCHSEVHGLYNTGKATETRIKLQDLRQQVENTI